MELSNELKEVLLVVENSYSLENLKEKFSQIENCNAEYLLFTVLSNINTILENGCNLINIIDEADTTFPGLNHASNKFARTLLKIEDIKEN